MKNIVAVVVTLLGFLALLVCGVIVGHLICLFGTKVLSLCTKYVIASGPGFPRLLIIILFSRLWIKW